MVWDATHISGWDKTAPAGTHYPNIIDDAVREIKTVVENSVPWRLVIKDQNYTLQPNDTVVLVDATYGNRTITLPTAVGKAGKRYVIVRYDTNHNYYAMVMCTGGETVDGYGARKLLFYKQVLDVVSDGANWIRDSRFYDVITTDTTLTVGSPALFGTLSEALNFLKDKIIGGGVTVTIKFTDGTHYFSQGFEWDHPYSKQIILEGNTTSYQSCVLKYTPLSGKFITVRRGNVLRIRGFDIQGSSNSTDNTGLHVYDGGVVEILSKTVRLYNFYYATQVMSGGVLNADFGAYFQHCEVGLYTVWAGIAAATAAVISDCYIGVLADRAGFCAATSSSISDCTTGAYAKINSVIDVIDTTFTNVTTNTNQIVGGVVVTA